MLRITRVEKASAETLLIVEGRLVGPWVAELKNAVIGADTEPEHVTIDLSAVSFVDARGLKLLHQLMAQGVVLHTVSPFVQALLIKEP